MHKTFFVAFTNAFMLELHLVVRIVSANEVVVRWVISLFVGYPVSTIYELFKLQNGSTVPTHYPKSYYPFHHCTWPYITTPHNGFIITQQGFSPTFYIKLQQTRANNYELLLLKKHFSVNIQRALGTHFTPKLGYINTRTLLWLRQSRNRVIARTIF